MAIDTYVDTSGFYAWLVAQDDTHQTAAELLGAAATGHRNLHTCDYVLDETATLLSARGLRHVAFRFLAQSMRGPLIIHWSNSERFDRTTKHFARAADKNWSFTDCLSMVLMEEFAIQEVITKDRHFQQAGFKALLCLENPNRFS